MLNFQPMVAAAIYTRFAGPGAVIFDPCAGWGGRLLGAAAAQARKYIACEVSSQTCAGLQKMAEHTRRSGMETRQLLFRLVALTHLRGWP